VSKKEINKVSLDFFIWASSQKAGGASPPAPPPTSRSVPLPSTLGVPTISGFVGDTHHYSKGDGYAIQALSLFVVTFSPPPLFPLFLFSRPANPDGAKTGVSYRLSCPSSRVHGDNKERANFVGSGFLHVCKTVVPLFGMRSGRVARVRVVTQLNPVRPPVYLFSRNESSEYLSPLIKNIAFKTLILSFLCVCVYRCVFYNRIDCFAFFFVSFEKNQKIGLLKFLCGTLENFHFFPSFFKGKKSTI